MKKEKQYRGVVIPAVTPLTADYQLDRAAVETLYQYFRENNTMMFVMGTTGESSSIPPSIKREYVKQAVSLKQPGELLYAGIASNCLEESVNYAKEFFDMGADVAVAHLPSYFTLSDDQIRKYYELLADQVPGPLMIYNIPSTTHLSIPVSVIDELSHHENIVGIKDSERNEERLEQSLKLWADREDFSHLLGWAAKASYALLNGSDGLVPSTGNIIPGVYADIYRFAKAGDAENLARVQKHSEQVGNLYQGGRLLGESLWALKVLMHEAGLCQPVVMPPLTSLPQDTATTLRQGLHELVSKEGVSLNTPLIHA